MSDSDAPSERVPFVPASPDDKSKCLNERGTVDDLSRANLVQLFGGNPEALRNVEALIPPDPRELASNMYEFGKLDFAGQTELLFRLPELTASNPFKVPQSYVDELVTSGKKEDLAELEALDVGLSECQYLEAPDGSIIVLIETASGQPQRFLMSEEL